MHWRAIRKCIGVLCAGFLAGAIFLTPSESGADTWLPPSVASYESANHTFRLTITPRQLQGQLQYFEDKVEGREPAGQNPGGPREARGRLERRTAEGQWITVWDKPLVNEVGPVGALVSDTGEYVATFDNWHSVGLGEHVVVIHDREGRLIRTLRLTEIVPETYAQALPRSVSSLWWGGTHRIEGEQLILEVAVPSEEGPEHQRYVEAVIDMATGMPRPLEGEAWRTALAEADRVDALNGASEAAERARMRAPLLGPVGGGEQEWFGYLSEAFFRLDPAWSETYPAVEVLRRPEAADYAPSLGWLQETLRDSDGPGDIIMLGSPDPENLVRGLAETMALSAPAALEGVTVYIAVGSDLWPRVERAFASSGARLVQLDPARPIPQRAERMPDPI